MAYEPIENFLEKLNISETEPDKDFDNWNILKKQTDSSEAILENFPKKGEVWMIILGKNIGSEQNGTGDDFMRPMVIIAKINNQMFWCIPLSTKQKDIYFYINFSDPENQKVTAIVGQLRLISIKRFQRRMYDLPWVIFDNIKKKIKNILN